MNKQLKVAVRGGHNFLAPGAVGLIDETIEDVALYKRVGHDKIGLTIS